MLEALMDQVVGIYQLDSLGDRAEPVYTEVEDSEGFPIRLACHLEEKQGRAFRLRGVEISGDANMLFVVRADGIPREADIVRPPRGKAYKIVSLEKQKQFGSGIEYARATLAFTKLPLKALTEIGEGLGE